MISQRATGQSTSGPLSPYMHAVHNPAPGGLVNVGHEERMTSAIVGGGLAWFGISRGSLSGLLLTAAGGALLYRGLTGHCGLYQKIGVNTAVQHRENVGVRAQHGFKLVQAITVNRPRNELYAFWRKFENLPRIMRHLISVTEQGNQSHWMAQGPFGKVVEWDAELINEQEHEMLAWRSLEGADVDTAGSVHFETLPHDRGTVVRVSLKYDPPGGRVGEAIATLLGEGLEHRLEEDLRGFKRIMESGEMPVGGFPSARRAT